MEGNLKEFYFYDSGRLPYRDLDSFLSSIEDSGIGLFTGIDDPKDPELGYDMVRGYRSFLRDSADPLAGTLSDWSFISNTIKRMIVLEIPSKCDLKEKYKLVELIFENLLPKLYNT